MNSTNTMMIRLLQGTTSANRRRRPVLLLFDLLTCAILFSLTINYLLDKKLMVHSDNAEHSERRLQISAISKTIDSFSPKDVSSFLSGDKETMDLRNNATNDTTIMESKIQKNTSLSLYNNNNNDNNKTARACLIYNGDPGYLEEWIDYQFAVGFTDIRICDNSDSFQLRNYSLPQYDKSKIRITHLPTTKEYKTKRPQNICYKKCLEEALLENITWASTFDADEFLVLKKHDNLIEFMDDVCRPPKCGQISIIFQMFGHSNRTRHANVPITRRFMHALSKKKGQKPNTSHHSTHIKAIVNPQAAILDIPWFHAWALKKGWKSLDPEGNTQPSHRGWKRMVNLHSGKRKGIAALYHYKFRSEEEWNRKCVIGSFGKQKNVCTSGNNGEIDWQEQIGDRYDDSAWEFLKKKVPKYQKYDNVTDLGGGLPS